MFALTGWNTVEINDIEFELNSIIVAKWKGKPSFKYVSIHDNSRFRVVEITFHHPKAAFFMSETDVIVQKRGEKYQITNNVHQITIIRHNYAFAMYYLFL